MRIFVEKKLTIPKGFVPKEPREGTTANLYLTGKRQPAGLMDDSDLMWVIDDKHPEGGLLYVFKDHSSVVYIPNENEEL